MSSTNTNNPPSSSNSNDNEGDDTENEPLFDAIAGIGFAGFTGDNNNNLEEDAEEQAIMNEPLEVDYGSDSDESGRLSNDDADEYGGGSISSSIHSEKYSAELSKRTASLIDNFRDYVSKIDDNDKDVEKGVATTLLKPSSSLGNNKNKNNKFGMSRRGKSPGRSRNNNNQKNNDDKDYDTPIIIKGDVNWYGKDGILRDFNTTNINEEGDYDLSGGSGYYDQYCKGNHNRRNYMGRYGILQSRRVKRGIGLFAIAVILIGVIYGSTNNNKENEHNLPDWDEELDEIMEEEEIEYEMEQNKEHENNFLDGKVGVGSIMAPGVLPQPGDQPQHDVTSDVPQQQSQPQPQLSDKPSDSTANNMISDVLSHANSMATAAANNNNHNGNNFVSETGHGPSNKYLEMAQKYHPIWYSRSSSPTNNNNNNNGGVPSYTGTNYNDALLFCAQQNERIPCPYDAICPEGPDNVPAGGYRESYQVSSPDGTSKGGTSEGVTQWAPIIDHVNSWVQVSSNDNNGCMLYTLLHDGHNPSWGVIQPRGEDIIVGTEGDKEILNEEGTRFILCCVSVADSAEEKLDHLEADLALNEAEGKLSMEEADEILAEAEVKKEEVEDDNMEEGANYKPSDETLELMKEEEDILHEIDNDQQPVSEILTDAENNNSNVPLSDTEYSHVERYEPMWYYRNTGWDGQTYQEAVNFCNNDLHDGEGALCPYEVICPAGPKQRPFGGDIEEKEPINNNGDDSTSISTQWVALADSRNDWVQVSPGEGLCETYMSLNLEDPLWGLSGKENEGITRHILCCRKSPLGEEKDAEAEGIQKWEDDDDDAAPLPDSYDGVKPLEVLDNSEENIVNEMNKHPISESVIATEQAHAMEYEPIWYYRANGWDGQSYQDAVVFCNKDPLRETGSGTLCPYEVLCPSGPNFYPFGGEIDEKEPISETDSDPMLSTQWVAVSDSKNDWVQVSPGKGMCQTYMSLHLEDPLWGLSGKENEQTTRHILCCRTMPDSANEDSTNESVASVAEESIPEPPSTTTMEKADNDVPLFVQYEPLWYYRNNGWEGQTYQDAINFCSMDLHEYGEGALCPYEVICPAGPKQRPFGGVIEEKEQINGKTSISTQWVALADSRNDWVQVSPGEGLCETYMSLNLEEPLWGLSGKENEGITRHILCCRKTPLVNDNGSVTESKVDDIPKPTTNDAPPSNNEMSVPTNNVNAAYVTPKLYQPVWYNRESGWKGYTYDAATDFCTALGAGHQLCPYEVICPLGEAKTPYGGGFDSSGSIWTPTSDSYNDWVQISNSLHARSKPCMTYSALHSGPPTWGVIYDGSDSTLHVENLLCCRSVDSESSEVATATTSATTLKPTSRPTPLPAPTPTIPNSVPTEQTSIMAKELAHIYQQIPDKYQATGFGRYQGWLGQTYLEGQNYCSKNMGASHEPCSYDVLCPRGIGDEASGDIETDIWAPVFDMYSEKSWVGLRKGGYCEKHTSILEFEDVTRYILCCKRDVYLSVSSTQLTPISATTADSVPTADKEVAEFHNNKHEHNPESFDRVQWSGQTYSEALLFCAEQNGKIPCPYDAICPSGRGNPPVGGKRGGQAGDWAPIMDTANGWVQIGQRDTCTKYNDVKPHPPEWGLTGEENEAITRNIICCDEPADPSLSLESAPAVVSEPQTKAEEMILDTMHPIWFERKHGYHGMCDVCLHDNQYFTFNYGLLTYNVQCSDNYPTIRNNTRRG